MNRREFSAASIAAALANASFASNAQGKVFQIGLLANSILAADLGPPMKTVNPAPKIIEDGLRQLGWVDGRNVRLIWKTAAGRYERWPELIDEFLRMRVDVLVVFADGPAQIALKKTRTTPIVLAGMGRLLDPKVIESLQRPGVNLTGMSIDDLNLGPKRVELLKAAVPSVSRVAVLVHYVRPANPAPGEPAPFISAESQAAARKLGISLFAVEFERLADLPRAFSEIAAKGANGLLVGESSHLYYREWQLPIHELTIKHRLPAMWRIINAVESGALLAYAPDILEFYRSAPRYIDKILRGGKAADIPIETPSKFEFLINLKTARAIGITIPSFVLSLADRVIE